MINGENDVLKNILKWLRFIGWPKAKEVLDDILRDDVDRLIYHYSDGEHGIRDIIRVLPEYGFSTSFGGVHGRWQRWAQNGLLEPIPVGTGTRYVKIFNLADFGIDIPERRSNLNDG